MTHPRVIRAAAQRKAQKGRRGLMRKAPDIRAPRAIEHRYRAALLAYVEDLRAEAQRVLIDALPRIIEQRNATRADAWDEDLSNLLDAVTVFGRRRAQWAIRDLAGYADSVNTWNRSQFNRATRAVIGVDIFGGSDGEALQAAARSWARENASLITNITDKTMTEIEGITQRAVRAGANPRDVARDIQARFEVSESRARLIARDQIAKLNGQLTQTRNEALGIDKYIWSTSEDERVRDSHRVMNGKLCRWDNPGVYSEDGGQTWQSRSSIGGYVGHPGEDYQCRCISSPYMDDILAEIGA